MLVELAPLERGWLERVDFEKYITTWDWLNLILMNCGKWCKSFDSDFDYQLSKRNYVFLENSYNFCVYEQLPKVSALKVPEFG